MSTLDDMLTRYRELEALKLRIEGDMHAIERGLHVAGVVVKRGRPSPRPTHTVTEAREAHRLYQRGDRTARVVLGERQYQRENKRARRSDTA